MLCVPALRVRKRGDNRSHDLVDVLPLRRLRQDLA
jgi:hypothetical protein